MKKRNDNLEVCSRCSHWINRGQLVQCDGNKVQVNDAMQTVPRLMHVNCAAACHARHDVGASSVQNAVMVAACGHRELVLGAGRRA